MSRNPQNAFTNSGAKSLLSGWHDHRGRVCNLMTTRLDRIVELQSRTVTRDSYGGEIVSWSEIDKVWANVNQTGVSENFENESNRDIALRNSTIRIRWRDDVRESGRVVYDGFPWDIKGIAELGYRRELELFCQTDVHRPETAFTPVTDAGRILWGANTLVTWGGGTEIIWRGI